jgi:CRP-like cAMP-binding protein
VEKYLQLLVSQSEIPETTLRWLQNSATDEEKRSLTLVLSCCSTLVLDQSELLSKRLSFREINFLENSVPNYLRYLVSESTSEERQILHRLFHQMVRWRFEAYFLDGYKTDLLSDWLLATDDFESAQDFVQIVFKLKHWYLRDELFQHIKKVPIFKKVSTEAIKALVSNVVLKVTKAGEVVILEGDTGDEMYFIVDGSVLILEKGERYTDLKTCKVIAELGRGSYFGEIVLLQGVYATRTRTVVCKTDCQLYVLNNDQFSVVMDIYPELRWSINQEAQRRAKPANEDLILNSSCLDVAQEDAPEIIGDMRKSVQTKDLQNDNRREQVSSIVTSHSHGVASIGKHFC